MDDEQTMVLRRKKFSIQRERVLPERRFDDHISPFNGFLIERNVCAKPWTEMLPVK